jgi:hypothetical protein
MAIMMVAEKTLTILKLNRIGEGENFWTFVCLVSLLERFSGFFACGRGLC